MLDALKRNVPEVFFTEARKGGYHELRVVLMSAESKFEIFGSNCCQAMAEDFYTVLCTQFQVLEITVHQSYV